MDVFSTSWKGAGSMRILAKSTGLAISCSSHARCSSRLRSARNNLYIEKNTVKNN